MCYKKKITVFDKIPGHYIAITTQKIIYISLQQTWLVNLKNILPYLL